VKNEREKFSLVKVKEREIKKKFKWKVAFGRNHGNNGLKRWMLLSSHHRHHNTVQEKHTLHSLSAFIFHSVEKRRKKRRAFGLPFSPHNQQEKRRGKKSGSEGKAKKKSQATWKQQEKKKNKRKNVSFQFSPSFIYWRGRHHHFNEISNLGWNCGSHRSAAHTRTREKKVNFRGEEK
jgi:hypothetical protein